MVGTVTVTWAEPEAGTCTGEEESEHVAPLGTPLQESDTGTSNPLRPVIVNVYFAVCPAWTVSLVGEAARVKSANCTDSASVAVDVPGEVLELLVLVDDVVVVWLAVATVPVTVKLSEDEVTALRFPTVSVLDCPGDIDVGLKAHVAGATLAQPRTMDPVNPLFDDADSVNCAWALPSRTVTEGWLA